MKLRWHVTPFGEECVLTALTSSSMDETDWTSPTTTLSEKKLSPHLALQRRCISGQARRGVKDVTVSGV